MSELEQRWENSVSARSYDEAQATIARLEARVAELEGASEWRKREEHDPLFEDGERMLAALRVVYTPRGRSTDIGGQRCYWHVETISIRCDEHYFAVHDSDDEVWGWDWSDVEYWIPMNQLISALPPTSPTEQPSAAREGEQKAR